MSDVLPSQLDRHLLYVVSPCFNETAGIETFYMELKGVLETLPDIDHRVLLVDDGSTDGTLERLNALSRRDPKVLVYSLSRNFGHQVAISCGLDQSAAADAVVVMDSDLQHPPSMIPVFVERWREGYDVVQAVRGRTAGVSKAKSTASRGFYRLFNWLSDMTIRDGAADFYLISRRVRTALANMPERSRFLRGMLAWVGFPSTSVPYEAPARVAGVSKYTLPRMVALAFDGILSFSSRPIRLATRAGLVLVFLGLLYLGYIVGRWWILGDLVPGWASVISIVLILGGAQMAFIGLIGEYLARVFDESKRRPLYLLKQAPGIEPDSDVRSHPSLTTSGNYEGEK